MNRAAVQRLTWVLFFGQSLGSAGYIAGSTVATIVGDKLSGRAALAGVPGFVYLLGSAAAAFPAARLMEHSGRRLGLALGFALGVGGALLAGWSVLVESFPFFLVGMVIMGAANGSTNLARYGAAEMHPVDERGRAISLVVLGGTFGAIVGPSVVGPMGQLAESLHRDALAGPWLASAVLFGVGALLISLFLRPDPRDLGRTLEAAGPAESAAPAGPLRPVREVLALSGAQAAIAALVVGQVVMVMIMAITSLHMVHHNHGLGDVSLVIMAHTLGMFGLSLVTGRLVDRLGRGQTIMAGTGILILACLLAPLSQNTYLLALALFLLGLGWNFCYVAGGAMLTDMLTVTERGRWQGSIDLLISLVSAAGSLGSGAIFAALGFAWMSWFSLAVTLVPLALALNFILRRPQPRVAALP